MPENYPGIKLNEEGVCNLCLSHKARNGNPDKNKLVTLVKSFKENNRYDCIVPLSGGKESTYVLYYAVEELGLKPLAVNYDSGFQNKLAAENMSRSCRVLNVPLVTKRANQVIQKNLLREAIKISNTAGTFFHICGNCEVALRAVSMSVAREYKIPVVLWGSSSEEDISSYSDKHMGKKAFMRRMSARKIFKILPHIAKYSFISIKQRIELKIPLRYAINPIGPLPFPESKPKFVHFFDYILYDYQRQAELIKDKLGWKHPEDKDFRFDCALHCFGNYSSTKLTNISSDGIIYCNYIRNNMMNRAEALEREKNLDEAMIHECKEIIHKLGISGIEILE